MLFSDGGRTKEARGIFPSLWEHEALFIGTSRCSQSADGDLVPGFLLLGLWWQKKKEVGGGGWDDVCPDVLLYLASNVLLPFGKSWWETLVGEDKSYHRKPPLLSAPWECHLSSLRYTVAAAEIHTSAIMSTRHPDWRQSDADTKLPIAMQVSALRGTLRHKSVQFTRGRFDPSFFFSPILASLRYGATAAEWLRSSSRWLLKWQKHLDSCLHRPFSPLGFISRVKHRSVCGEG